MARFAALAALVATASAAGSTCPDRYIDTSNIVFVNTATNPDTYIKCDGTSCSDGLQFPSQAALCSAAFGNLGWTMVSWKGGQTCLHAPGYSYELSGGTQTLLLGTQSIFNVGNCNGQGVDSIELDEEMCRCGVPRDTTAWPSSTTTRTSSSTTSTTSSSTTTRSSTTSTTSSSTTTRSSTSGTTTSTTTTGGGESMGPFENSYVQRLFAGVPARDLLPGGRGFGPMLFGAAGGVALGLFGAVAVLRLRSSRRTVAGQEYDGLEAGEAGEAGERLLE